MNKVALLIPHYNNPFGLIKSLNSIDESEEIDVYIVDDGSTEHKIKEVEINNSFKSKGSIFYIYLEYNQGIEYALNEGIDQIIKKGGYNYIARLDCGDLCLGKRFQIQQKFLNENLEFKLIGANIICTDREGNYLYTIKYPQHHENIRKKMYLNSMFSHPTVMFSVDLISKIGKYPSDFKAAEDYAFFFNIVDQYKTTNLQEVLLNYEINPEGISISKRKTQVKSRLKVIIKHYYFGFWPTYGLIRNFLLYIIPYFLILKIKKLKN